MNQKTKSAVLTGWHVIVALAALVSAGVEVILGDPSGLTVAVYTLVAILSIALIVAWCGFYLALIQEPGDEA